MREEVPKAYPTMRISPPPAPPSDWLQHPHGIMQMLLDHQWTARREVLKVLGFILYQLLQDQNWHSKIWTPSFIANVDCLQLLSSHRCGVIINPFSTNLQDIVNFVRHHIPVHYPWRKDNPINPPHFLDPYTFPTHRFNFWETANNPMDAKTKSNALLRRPMPPHPPQIPLPTWGPQKQKLSLGLLRQHLGIK
jgi:hypothetical protein